ncbi:hypothetical protein DL240_19105 [Lujinxingia litoralis]|uniref:Uncharacterized protein n=2 Tax=Lujinxingia litoralis TaxID=2211119 RepID=A0A328C0C0_9DELT|nr:hypothetical protein DL240_19105 [Lujinxingia litoralis]
MQTLSQQVAEAIARQFTEFEGHALRCDAGEPGMIYVALRGAKRDAQAGERLAGELDRLVRAELARAGATACAPTIMMGRGDKDLLLRVMISAAG